MAQEKGICMKEGEATYPILKHLFKQYDNPRLTIYLHRIELCSLHHKRTEWQLPLIISIIIFCYTSSSISRCTHTWPGIWTNWCLKEGILHVVHETETIYNWSCSGEKRLQEEQHSNSLCSSRWPCICWRSSVIDWISCSKSLACNTNSKWQCLLWALSEPSQPSYHQLMRFPAMKIWNVNGLLDKWHDLNHLTATSFRSSLLTFPINWTVETNNARMDEAATTLYKLASRESTKTVL